jgi:hypothetical protein
MGACLKSLINIAYIRCMVKDKFKQQNKQLQSRLISYPESYPRNHIGIHSRLSRNASRNFVSIKWGGETAMQMAIESFE